MRNFSISVDLVQCREDGSIVPNPLFHRPWNKLHSRCIEYPFAASQIVPDKALLDLGSDKADKIWFDFLKSVSVNTVFFDYERTQPNNQKMILGDCRYLPFKDNVFDIICAVSLIEHIGLENAQTTGANSPDASQFGDLEAIAECARVLKPHGKLIMTLPMGVRKGYFSSGSARVYVKDDIKGFSSILKPVILDYYEFRVQKAGKFYPICKLNNSEAGGGGLGAWQRIPLADAAARNDVMIDGILASVWEKN